jgi:hypothetical protein
VILLDVTALWVGRPQVLQRSGLSLIRAATKKSKQTMELAGKQWLVSASD